MKLFTQVETHCEPTGDKRVSFAWSKKGIGWGEFVIYRDGGTIVIDNEIMSKGFIKEMLCRMVDSAELVDVMSPEKEAGGEQRFKEYVASVVAVGGVGKGSSK